MTLVMTSLDFLYPPKATIISSFQAIAPHCFLAICMHTIFALTAVALSECNLNKIKSKSSLYSPYYAEACDELRGPSPRLSAWATQLRRNVATVASRWRHWVDLTGPGIEPQTSRTDSVSLATELTAGFKTRRNNIFRFQYLVLKLVLFPTEK